MPHASALVLATEIPVGDVADLGPYDAYVIGSAIYAGSWLKEATNLIEDNTSLLKDRPVWLFSSGPVEGPVDDHEEQPRQLAGFRRTIDVREHVVFGGRLDPDLLGFGERMIMKAVKAQRSDSRNWEEIAAWAAGVGAALVAGPGE